MIINGTDYTVVVVGFVCALLFFALQYALLVKAKRKIVKFIPVGINLLCAMIIGADLAGAFDNGSGMISTRGIAATVFAIFTACALAGEAAAWYVYSRRNREDNEYRA